MRNIRIEDEFKHYMTVGDIYKHKKNHSLIRIDSYASPMNESYGDKKFFVFCQVQKHCGEYEKLPISFYYYGTQEEIESEYELSVSAGTIKQDYLSKLPDWHGYLD